MVSPPITIGLKRLWDMDRSQFEEIVSRLGERQYTIEEGYGFVTKEKSINYASFYFIVDYPTYIYDFNDKTMAVQKIKTMRKKAIPFAIDFNYHTIEVSSDKKNLKLIINEISKISEYKLNVEDVIFKASEVIKKLETCEASFQINTLRIRDFSINEYTIGSFFVKVLEQHEGLRLIEEYNESITYVGLSVEINGECLSIGIFDSGTIKAYGQYSDVSNVIAWIKYCLLTGDRNA